MKKDKQSLIVLGACALVMAVLCLAGAAAGGIAYYSYQKQAPQPLQGWLPQVFDTATKVPDQSTTPLNSEIDLAELFKPVWESRQLLHDNYVDQPIDDQVLAEGALQGLKQTLEDAEIDPDDLHATADAPTAEELSAQAGTPEEISQEFQQFWQAWRDVQYSQLDTDLTYERLMQNSLRYMVASLGDPYTAYFDPIEHHEIQESMDSDYEGIGAWVDTSAEYFTIIAPMEGSPAEEAGLLPGDRVIAIDGEDMTGVPGDIVLQHVLGPAGSKVVLTISRDGVDEPFDVEITRRRIVVPTLYSEMKEGNIAYIQLYNFGENSAQQVHNAIREALKQNPVGLILDLRNNGGGYVHAAVDITSEFIDEGVVLYEVYGDGTRIVHNALKGGIATDIPLVVLINQGSASASEIVAGAIRDHERGLLVGDTSFGKSAVLLPIDLSNDKGALYITIGKFLSPEEHDNRGIGIDPDVFVEITQEDVDAGIDPQLEKAIELLTTS